MRCTGFRTACSCSQVAQSKLANWSVVAIRSDEHDHSAFVAVEASYCAGDDRSICVYNMGVEVHEFMQNGKSHTRSAKESVACRTSEWEGAHCIDSLTAGWFIVNVATSTTLYLPFGTLFARAEPTARDCAASQSLDSVKRVQGTGDTARPSTLPSQLTYSC